MNDNFFNTGLLALMVALAVAACASAELSSRRKAAAATADMTVVMLPAVSVTGKRVPATDGLAGVAPQLVQLPLVSVEGRRTPATEAVALAQLR